MIPCKVGICLLLATVVVGINTDASEPHFIGSLPASITEFPYQLSFRYQQNHICNAAIISSTWGISTASCLQFRSPNLSSVRAGSDNRLFGGRIYQVSRIVVYPGYRNATRDNDIAIFNVTVPFAGSSSVRSISLASEFDSLPAGSIAVASGWGSISPIVNSTNLRKLSLPIVNQTRCAAVFNGRRNITRNMLCAGVTGQRKDVCDGLGAPLVRNSKLIGIASWYYGCATGIYPHIFTRISVFNSWIRSIIGR